MDEFTTLAVILGLAIVVGFVANRLRQPLIVAFIAVGIVVGPVGFGWVEGGGEIELLAEVGIAVLLFLVGLKLDLHLVRSTGPVALATGLGQVTFTSVFGFLISLALGLDTTTAIYVAVALTFSSTIIIVKLLSDKREIEQQHGRIAVGFLIVQDIVVVIVMIVLTAIGGAGEDTVLSEILEVLAKGFGFLLAIVLVTKLVLGRVLHVIARSSELLVLSSVAWAVVLAATSDQLGFSSEVGAFLAGISLAATPYREAIASRLVSLRDFLLLFFFIELGARLEFTDAASQISQAVVLSAFVLIGNPIIVLIIMGAMGYRKRTSFLAGLTVAQISEFSLILIALGFSLGHVDSSAVGLVTVVGLITIGMSTYMILYSQQIFDRLSPLLSVFEREGKVRELEEREEKPVDVILYGYGRYGSAIATELLDTDVRLLVVESDPQIVAALGEGPPRIIYGDAEDLEFTETLPVDHARWVVCTVPLLDANLALLHSLQALGFTGKFAAVSHSERESVVLREAGTDVVLRPYLDAATPVRDLLVGDPTPSPDHG
ncbi:MAG: cation:proton antiporter [Acidimicrobiia bacterium]|nr:cation:proton antiporter [Acidimicrobiia bacterium]